MHKQDLWKVARTKSESWVPRFLHLIYLIDETGSSQNQRNRRFRFLRDKSHRPEFETRRQGDTVKRRRRDGEIPSSLWDFGTLNSVDKSEICTEFVTEMGDVSISFELRS